MYFAHSTKNPDKKDWQPLKIHLTNVANLSQDFADDFKAGDLAYTSGLLHDLGKYSPDFQKRLEGSHLYVDHSTAGALEGAKYYHPLYSLLLFYIVVGHHGGLLNYGSTKRGLAERLKKTGIPDYSAYKDEITLGDLKDFRHTQRPLSQKTGFCFSFFTRMMYSSLWMQTRSIRKRLQLWKNLPFAENTIRSIS